MRRMKRGLTWAITMLLVGACATGTAPPSASPAPVAATALPTARPSATPAPSPTEKPAPSSSPAAELLAYLPASWADECIAGDSLIDGAIADVVCLGPTKGVSIVELVLYADALDAAGQYGDNFYEFGDETCPDHRRDGDFDIGGVPVGTAGGCTDGDWFAFTLDLEGVAGEIGADTFEAARDAFIRLRPFPDHYMGAITGPGFRPPPTFAELKGSAKRPSYSTLVHDNDQLQGDPVYYRGEVQQYTEDPDAPFRVLVWVRRESGTFTGGPVALVGYEGRALGVGDVIEVVGRVGPMVTYDSVGGSRTIPTLDVERVRFSD